MEQCKVCRRDFVYSRRAGHRRGKCNSCGLREKRMRRKKKMLDYLGHKCMVCGYKKSDRALSFHHINREEKEFSLSNTSYLKWERVEKELKKCVLLCANCHMEVEEGITDISGSFV